MTTTGPYRLARRLAPAALSDPRLLRLAARAIESAARFGYVARALVFLSVGVIALLAALGLTPRAKGAVEAMEAWGAWPPGVGLLWLTGLGLYAFAGWRALQSIFDADRLGRTPRALAERAGKGLSGLVYAGLAISLFGILDAIEDLGEADDQASTEAAIRAVLAFPGGDVAVIACGGLIVAAGVANVVRACRSHFTADLECGSRRAALAGSLARVGYAARGCVMAGAGVLTLIAGLEARASSAGGAGEALEWLHRQPSGPLWLGLLGLGLIAFAAFGFLKAWLRRIGC